MSKGTKNDSDYMKKPPVDLLTLEFKMETAKALGFGAGKYGRHNFKEGIEFSRLLAAAERHLTQFNAGQDNDDESGLSHLAHAAASLNMLMWMVANRPDLDDRYKNEESLIELIEKASPGAVTYMGSGSLDLSKIDPYGADLEWPDNSTE